MIELPSFKHKDIHSSGFLCVYHIAVLFRAPVRLGKLKDGDVDAVQEDFDHVIESAENYIAFKVTPVPKPIIPYMDDRNIPEQNEGTGKLGSLTPQGKEEGRICEPRKRICNQDSLVDPFTTIPADDCDPGVRSSKSSPSPSTLALPQLPESFHHKRPPSQHEVKLHEPGSNYKVIIDLTIDTDPVEFTERGPNSSLSSSTPGVLPPPKVFHHKRPHAQHEVKLHELRPNHNIIIDQTGYPEPVESPEQAIALESGAVQTPSR
jgi:hypothetical protein